MKGCTIGRGMLEQYVCSGVVAANVKQCNGRMRGTRKNHKKVRECRKSVKYAKNEEGEKCKVTERRLPVGPHV